MTIRNFKLDNGVDGNTATMRLNNNLYVQLHSTIVFKKEGSKVTINSGGYKTVSTKTLINKCFNQLGINAYLYQKKGVWLVELNSQLDSCLTVNFKDGMEINL